MQKVALEGASASCAKERCFDPESCVLLAMVEAVAADGIAHRRSDSGKRQPVNESVMLIIN